jgi:hypothetical protein
MGKNTNRQFTNDIKKDNTQKKRMLDLTNSQRDTNLFYFILFLNKNNFYKD